MTKRKPLKRSVRRKQGGPDVPRQSSTAQIVDTYCQSVLGGGFPSGKLLKLAVERHLHDLKDGLKRGLRFDPAKAERAVQWFGFLRHSKGEWAGRPFVLEPWEMFVVWVLFGWQRQDGTRRFRTGYMEVARKNGKSTLCAGIGLLLAFGDNEPGAEVYAAATKREQALIVHDEATRMVRATPDLAGVVDVYKHNLSRKSTYQKFEPLGADENTMDGLNAHGTIIDELHAHRTRMVYDVLQTSMGSRRQPLLFAITTAGTDQTEGAICWEQHTYTEQVLRGTIQDDGYFGMIFAMDEGDSWQDEQNWYKSNPNLGVSKKLDYMRSQAKKAAGMPGFLNSFLRLECNQWTQQTTRWIDLLRWDAQAGEPIDEAELVGRRCYGGLDLSSVSDITAWVLLFPDPIVTDRLDILVRFWVPEARLQLLEEKETFRRNRYAEQYQLWARNGLITTTPGNAIDYSFVEAQIAEDAKRFDVQEIGIDRLFQGYHLAMQLQEHHGLTVAACGMGFMSMAGPCAELERRLLGGYLHHGGNPVLRWMADNVSVKMDPAGNLKPDKSSSQGKIDGIVGILLALDRVMRQQAAGSVYEKRGLIEM